MSLNVRGYHHMNGLLTFFSISIEHFNSPRYANKVGARVHNNVTQNSQQCPWCLLGLIAASL
jgi:hypothetical protein